MKTIIDWIIGLLTKILSIFIPKRFSHLLTYETVSYLFFGGVTTVVGLGGYILLSFYFSMSTAWATAVSSALSIILAFVTNKIFVFESTSWRTGVLVPELVKFGGSRVFTSVVDTLAMVLLVDVLGFHEMLMRLLTIIVIQVMGNYVLSKWVVFAKGDYNNTHENGE
ncbi:MAG: GtrA family protein [Defluviitaleaceae bacterium]|nr:GtrA family protein [Defluviitaleaceae bacterium]